MDFVGKGFPTTLNAARMARMNGRTAKAFCPTQAVNACRRQSQSAVTLPEIPRFDIDICRFESERRELSTDDIYHAVLAFDPAPHEQNCRA